MLPALFALAVTGCGGDDPAPVDTQWAQELKTEMTQYLGLVLPYVQFNQDTLYHRWDTADKAYIIGDYQETSVLDDYGTRLTRTGWTATTTTEGLAYVKTTEVGELTLFADFYEADDEDPAGNEIVVYVEEEGGGTGDDPVTGTYTFKMADMGWADQLENPSIVAEPGLTIITDPGENTKTTGIPKYYNNGASIRLYALNTLTLSADKITEIEFTFTSVTDSQTMTPDEGSITAWSNEGATWKGDASEIVFTLGTKGQVRISEMKVTGTFSGGGDVPPGPGDERTIADVALDICDELGYTASDIEWDGEEAYISAVFEGVTNLLEACEAGIDYLPDYLEEDTAPYEDEWDDGDPGYFAYYVDSDNFVYVSIGSYADGNDFVTQFWVFYGY